MKFLRFFVFLFTALPCALLAQDWKSLPYEPQGSFISFPKDEGSHPAEPIEWWYCMGHLKGVTTGRNYSFMLSYFRYPYLGFGGFRILNFSNDDNGRFFTETLPVNYNVLSKDSFNISAAVFNRGTETWANRKDDNGKSVPFEYKITAGSGATRSLNLNYTSTKRPLILADSGFFYQGASSYTYYYSQTGNTVHGTIKLDGTTENVTGSLWVDRQYGSFNPVNKEKYEWFCLQLSDGMDINLFNIFTENNLNPDTITYKTMGVYVSENQQYTTSDFKIERLGFAYNADSSMCYSTRWHLTSPVNKVDLYFSVLHKNTEVTLPFRFFEGAINIRGTVNGKQVTGKGFAELLKSYQKPLISLDNVSDLTPDLLTWTLDNPDDGRPVLYDIAYSADGNKTFIPVIKALSDTFYNWQDKPSGEFTLRVTAYTPDSVLKSSAYKTVHLVPTGSEIPQYEAGLKYFLSHGTGTLNFRLQKGFSDYVIRITDLHGNYLNAEQIRKENLIQADIKDFKPGMYICILESDNKTLRFRFVKE